MGNGVATLVMARWEGDLDRETLKRELDRGPLAAGDPLLASAEAD